MQRRHPRWRTGRPHVAARPRRSHGERIRRRDWIKLLLLLGLILFLGLGEPLRQLDMLLGYFGFR